MPVNRGINFELQSADVIHSFWIPDMGQKQDLVPGITTNLVITPTRTGTFSLICAELCGVGHATMRAPVRVVSQQAFADWVKQTKAGGAGAPTAGRDGVHVRGLRRLPCLHARRLDRRGRPQPRQPRRGSGEGGPDPAAYVKESIVDPDKVVASRLSERCDARRTSAIRCPRKEIDALVTYLTATK